MKSYFSIALVSAIIIALVIPTSVVNATGTKEVETVAIPQDQIVAIGHADKLDNYFYGIYKEYYVYPDDFGGMYLDEDGIFVLNVTSEEAIKKYENILGKDDFLKINVVPFSYNKLQEIGTEIYSAVFGDSSSSELGNLSGSFFQDVTKNSILFSGDDISYPLLKSKIEEVKAEFEAKGEAFPPVKLKEFGDIELQITDLGSNSAAVEKEDAKLSGEEVTTTTELDKSVDDVLEVSGDEQNEAKTQTQIEEKKDNVLIYLVIAALVVGSIGVYFIKTRKSI